MEETTPKWMALAAELEQSRPPGERVAPSAIPLNPEEDSAKRLLAAEVAMGSVIPDGLAEITDERGNKVLVPSDSIANQRATATKDRKKEGPDPCPSCGSAGAEVCRDGGSLWCGACGQLYHRCKLGAVTVGALRFRLGGPGPIFCPDCRQAAIKDGAVAASHSNPVMDAMTIEWKALGYI